MKSYPGDQGKSLINRKKFFEKLNLSPDNIVLAGLIHKDNITIVDGKNIGQKIENTDGLITSTPNVILAITVADCLPIYFFDKQNNIIGLAHAGWRGVEQKIAVKILKTMESRFDTDPKNVFVKIGPHIKNCHFEIKDDVKEKFKEYKNFVKDIGGTMFLDLASVVSKQLKEEGVASENINVTDECTSCSPEKYYSFRRDHPKQVEAMIAYVVMKD